jgi:hypothetical protein
MKWNWGAGLAAAYILFAAATSGFVVFAMNRPVALVRPDYYAESLREDQQMAARGRAQQLGSAVSIAVEGRDIRIAVPRTPQESTIAGRVTLYRASDPAADRNFPFAPDAAGVQRVAASGLRAGHWIVKLQWTSDGRDYYLEQPIVLP